MPSQPLLILELLDLIFSCLENADLASCTRVCKLWSEHSLNVLWRQTDNLPALFEILAPLVQVNQSPGSRTHYDFDSDPTAPDYQRWAKYTSRIRDLAYLNIHDEDCNGCNDFSPDMFNTLARTRLDLHIIPNLKSLKWITESPQTLGAAILFMTPHVTSLAVSIPREVSPKPFFREVVARMPDLQVLDLRLFVAMHEIETEVLECFRGLRSLKKVVLPECSITKGVMECLAKLPNLGIIQFEYESQQGDAGDIDDIISFKPVLCKNAFPSLWDLSLTASLSDMLDFITMPNAPSILTSLYIDSPVLETAASIQSFLTAIAGSCPLLRDLFLECLLLESVDLASRPRDNRVTNDTFRPLYECKNLVGFTFSHECPISMTQAELAQLAEAWPTLERLSLCVDPVITDGCTLTLECLTPFAQHCPELKILGLYVDALAVPNQVEMEPPRFPKLEKLAMGLSNIQNADAVAVYLSNLVSPECELTYGLTWHPGDDFDDLELALDISQREIKRRYMVWEQVGKTLPLLSKLRGEERARQHALEAEVTDLRTRNMVLVDRREIPKDTCIIF